MKAALARADTDTSVDPVARTRALVDKVMLAAWTLLAESGDEADRALAMARTLDAPELLIRALIAKGVVTAYDPELSQPYFAHANELAKGQDDPWIWSQLYIEEARSAMGAGDPPSCERAAAKALQVATAIGNHATVRAGHWALGWARGYQGDFASALVELSKAIDQAEAAHDTMLQLYGLLVQGFLRANLGDVGGARASADLALESASDLMEFFAAPWHATVAMACQAAGDGPGAQACVRHGPWAGVRQPHDGGGRLRVLCVGTAGGR